MVVKHQCSFCAGEIEPGTGRMYVKRDGTVFNFCSSSCRKQQIDLGRVGHRLKWTRAHAIKKAAEHSAAAAGTSRAAARASSSSGGRTKAKGPTAPAGHAGGVPAVSDPSPRRASRSQAGCPSEAGRGRRAAHSCSGTTGGDPREGPRRPEPGARGNLARSGREEARDEEGHEAGLRPVHDPARQSVGCPLPRRGAGAHPPVEGAGSKGPDRSSRS